MFYNVNTAKSVVRVFNLCFFIGNTCIYSFLSVFLRHLGLSALQVGLLRGLQSFTALICIPIVILCSRKCLQRRPPMMSCLFLTMAAYLSLLVVSLPAPSCFHKNYPVCENYTGHWTKNKTGVTPEYFGRHISSRSSGLAVTNDHDISLATEPLTGSNISVISDRTTPALKQGGNTLLHESRIETYHSVTSPDQVSSRLLHRAALTSSSAQFESTSKVHTRERTHISATDDQTAHDVSSHSYKVNQAVGVSAKKRSSIKDSLGLMKDSSNTRYREKSLLWPTVDMSCFIILLLILLIGEASASPVDTIANDAWFTYLDEIDYLVAYTKPNISIPVCTSLVVFCLGCITIFYCGSSPALNAYSLHIYMFGIFFGLALVTTTFYPFPQEQRSFSRNMVSVRHCLQNREAHLLLATATVSGIPQAAFTEFSLWFMEDLGGSEFSSTTCVAVAVLAVALPQAFPKRLQSISSRSAMVAFGVFCCAAQFLVYVSIQLPWAIVCSQLLQFASGCIFWTTLRQRLMKVLKLKSEHSFSQTLKAFHLVGYTLGVTVDGLLYAYSPTLLFSTMALLSLVWCLVLFFCEFCCLRRPTFSPSNAREEEMKLFDEMEQDSEDD